MCAICLISVQKEGHCNHRKCPKEEYKDGTWVEGAVLERQVEEIGCSKIGVQTNLRGHDRSV